MKSFWRGLLGSFLGCCIAIFIVFLIGIGMIGSLAAVASKSEPAIPKSAILKLDFKTPVSEQSSEQFKFNPLTMGANFSNSISLLSVIKAIEEAAKDPAIKFIYMTPETLNMGISQAEEIRSALKKFRDSGKAIVSYSTQFNNGNYYMASVADKVMFNSYGDAYIGGLSTNILFFKDLLDKLGVNMQLIRHGKFKAAAEQFIKSDISAENREQNQVMLNSIWGSWSEEIAESRGFSSENFNKWIDNLEITDSHSLIERHLIDQACYQDEVGEYLCSLFDVKDTKDLQFISIEKYAQAKVKPNVRAKSKIAVLYASGEIVIDGGDNNISGIKFAKTLEKVRKDSTVKAVVLRVNSPGGSAQAAEMINRELGLLKQVKPVIASYGDYAASGGYWISAKSDKIFTNNTTLTGSIGVFSLVPSVGNALNKNFHINNVSISTNKHSDALSGMRQMDEAELKYMQGTVERVYTDFTELVSEGRNLPVEKVDEIGQGRVWAGADALTIGLADTKGGLIDAIEYAAVTVNLADYQIVEYPVLKSTYEKLMESFSQTKTSIEILNDPVILIEKAYSSLKEETKITQYARLPYLYNIR
ncbi:MAG: signal peptide peptidase SppA [Bacteroidales bacterium]|nr:signal peptide peptidase SppA [Bacteroidales bacterium]MDD4670489.1 signal peptide peptidase SppA [Bacteroidales bacterium]